MQFYTGDWLKDPAVRACSLAARGLWFEILCLMWESPERGVLKTGDAPWGAQEMASAVGADVTLVVKLLAELKSKGVASARAEDGALYSRRMVRDETERRKETERQRRYRGSGQSVAPAHAGAGGASYAAPVNAARAENAACDDLSFQGPGGDACAVAGGVTPLSRDSSSSVSSSSTNLSLNFTGVPDNTGKSHQEDCRAKRSCETGVQEPRLPESCIQASAASSNRNTRLEELRLQAEILGRQERLRAKWPGANASAGVGSGPQPEAYGVRAKASAIERARAREEKAS